MVYYKLSILSRDFYNPIELNLGVNVKYSSDISLVCESGLWNNGNNISDKLFKFSDGLNSKLFFSNPYLLAIALFIFLYTQT